MIVVALSSLMLLGCLRHSTPAHADSPALIGLYSVPAEACSVAAQAGFDVVHDYAFETRDWDVDAYVEAARHYLDAAHRWDLEVLLGIPRPWAAREDADSLRRAIRALKDHPALLAWYEEERFLRGDYESVAFMDRIVNEVDPDNGFILEESKSDARLDALGRERMFTWYPVTAKARKAQRMISVEKRFRVSGREPAPWVSLQAFGRDRIAGVEDPDFLLPTWRELQYCLYASLIAGCRSVFFYSWMQPTRYDASLKARGRWPWTDYAALGTEHPDLWRHTQRAVRELRLLQGLLHEAAILEPLQLASSGTLRQGRWQTSEGMLVLVSNARYQPETLRTPVKQAQSYRILQPTGWSDPRPLAEGHLSLEIPGPGGVAVLLQ